MTHARASAPPDPDWIVPEWPAPPGVRALFTTRAGGVSREPYASFNLGVSTGDDPRAVDANRMRLRAVLPEAPRWLTQVHGARVVRAEHAVEAPSADACIADTPARVCAILVADCLPVLFADRSGRVVAAAHAGWRGLAAGVLENTLEAMADAGANPREVLAWIGPGIGPRAFEVGEEVRAAFIERDTGAGAAFVPHRAGKWLADLPALARRALERCGVTAVHGGEHCTYTDAQRFYSYRRDGRTGRMAALIWREEHV